MGFAKIKDMVMLGIGAAFKIFDTYSDMALAYLFYTGTYQANCNLDTSPDLNGNRCNLSKPQPLIAIVTILPTFFCCIVTTSYWWKVEIGAKQKTWTLPIVLLQLYLPFCDLRFIYLLFINDHRVIAAKRKYDTTMSTIGKSP